MQRITKFLQDQPVFYLATVDGKRPRVRPFDFFMEYEDRLYLATGKHKECYRQLQNNPYLELCATNDESLWLRISGQAVFDDRLQVAEEIFSRRPYLYDYYQQNQDKQLAAFYLNNGYGRIADKAGSFEEIWF